MPILTSTLRKAICRYLAMIDCQRVCRKRGGFAHFFPHQVNLYCRHVEYNKRDMLIIMPHSLSRAHADQHEQTDAQPSERDRDTRAMDTVT